MGRGGERRAIALANPGLAGTPYATPTLWAAIQYLGARETAYNARAIARLIEWAATGVETPTYASPEARNHEISFGATLSPIALRHLFDHSAVHRNVEWRDLPAEETVWMRTREVWIHAVDLANGATFTDIPAPVLERLLNDITGAWHTRGTDTDLVIKVTDRDLTLGDTTSDSPTVISGPVAAVVEWAAGRGTQGVTATRPGTTGATGSEAPVPAAPGWI